MSSVLDELKLVDVAGGNDNGFDVFENGKKFRRYIRNWEEVIETRGNNGIITSKSSLIYTVYQGAKPVFLSTYDYKWNSLSHEFIEQNYIAE